jgi:hypothetical protein
VDVLCCLAHLHQGGALVQTCSQAQLVALFTSRHVHLLIQHSQKAVFYRHQLLGQALLHFRGGALQTYYQLVHPLTSSTYEVHQTTAANTGRSQLGSPTCESAITGVCA